MFFIILAVDPKHIHVGLKCTLSIFYLFEGILIIIGGKVKELNPPPPPPPFKGQ